MEDKEKDIKPNTVNTPLIEFSDNEKLSELFNDFWANHIDSQLKVISSLKIKMLD